MTDYEVGDTILDDKPYAAVVSSTSLDCVCSFCFKNHVEFRCPLCNRLSYCSEECQEEDIFHDRVECIALADQEKILEDEVRLVIRTAVRYRYEQQRNYASQGNFFGQRRSFDDLESHIEDLNEVEKRKLKTSATHIKRILDRVGLSINRSELMEIYMKCKINCHLVIDHNEPDYLSRGRAIYLAASKLDHTCVASENYTLMFDGRRLVIRAIKGFTLNDPSELKIHYVPSNLAYNDRRERLLRNYFFLCSCSLCVSQQRFPTPENEADQKRVVEISALVDRYDPSSKAWFEEAEQLVQKFGDVPDDDFHFHWLLLHAQQAAADLGLFLESLELGSRALKGASTVMGIQRILFGLCSSMKRLGWCKSTSEHVENFKETRSIAKKLFSITHGKDHKIVRMICAPPPDQPETD